MPSPKLATSKCRVGFHGTDRERILLAIQRDPKATRTRIVKEMHVARSRSKAAGNLRFDPFPFCERAVDPTTSESAIVKLVRQRGFI